ncbi:ABC transporter permease [Lutimonas sp.]|uniref:ABC transporter permease n=1 Tax=Lutimonas sp. TaxID=1872403 RepID=UPI003D9AED71
MKQSLYLAIKYLTFYKFRTLVLVFCVGLILFLPIGLERLISESEEQMLLRANATPLIVGSKGGSTELVINTLYFEQDKVEPSSLGDVGKLNRTGLGYGIPILSVFKARGFPIVGTDLDYFSFRNLELQYGRNLQYVGECVLGSNVANELNLKVGDDLVSSPENFIDLAGVYPLKMKIVGVLMAANSPDDNGVFTDLKTNWIIMGLGHGHQDLQKVEDPTLVLQRDSAKVTASSKVFMYNEINDKNAGSFHFHGDMDTYPLSAIIFVPNDVKASTILRGRFESQELMGQIAVPTIVVDNLLQTIFRIKKIFNMVFILVGIATLIIISLIVLLTLRLRKDELFTMFTIGSSKNKTAEIIGFELVIMIFFSCCISFLLYQITGFFIQDFIQHFII